MRRREFITLIGGAAALTILGSFARAQQRERMRRIAVLMADAEGDPLGFEKIPAFTQGLAELGWSIGRNLRIDVRWGASNADRRGRSAKELLALSPDVVLATAGAIVGAFQEDSLYSDRRIPRD